MKGKEGQYFGSLNFGQGKVQKCVCMHMNSLVGHSFCTTLLRLTLAATLIEVGIGTGVRCAGEDTELQLFSFLGLGNTSPSAKGKTKLSKY